MNYAIYTRSANDDEQASITKKQLNFCAAFIKEYKLKGTFKHYSDPGISGMTLQRKALKQLLLDSYRGQIDSIIVKDVFRLSRNNYDLVNIIEFFARHNIKLIICKESIPCPLVKD